MKNALKEFIRSFSPALGVFAKPLLKMAYAWARIVGNKAILTGIPRFRGLFFPPGERFLGKSKIAKDLWLWTNLCESEGANLYFGKPFEPFTRTLIRKLLRPGDVFFDVGANIGLYSLLVSEWVGTGGVVHAFEPSPMTFPLLKKNIGLNRKSNIVAIPKAVSETSGESIFFMNQESGLSGLGDTGRGTLRSPQNILCTTLDDYVEINRITRIDCLKIDVEGFEGHVLRGAKSLFQKFPGMIIVSELSEENFRPLNFSSWEVVLWMLDSGFEAFGISQQERSLKPIIKNEDRRGLDDILFAFPGRISKELRLDNRTCNSR